MTCIITLISLLIYRFFDWSHIRQWVLFTLYFFFNDTATTEIYTLSLHDALPISSTPPTKITRHFYMHGLVSAPTRSNPTRPLFPGGCGQISPGARTPRFPKPRKPS